MLLRSTRNAIVPSCYIHSRPIIVQLHKVLSVFVSVCVSVCLYVWVEI